MPALDEMTPSVELLRALQDLEHAGLDTEQRLSAIAGYERLVSWLTACQTDLLADACRDYDQDPDTEPRWFAERVGMALGVAGSSACNRMRKAVTLTEKLPRLAAALRVGSITSHHVRLATTSVRVLDVGVARAVDAAVTADPDWRTPSQLERALARKIIELDPAGAAARHEARRRERDVTTRNEPDGMMSLWALLPAEQGMAVAKKIEAHARSSAATNTPGDDRLAQRRADALVELVCRDCVGTEPKVHGRRPEIGVLISLSTLMGCDDAPANLQGYGWIDATAGRRIAADPNSVWRRIIVDPVNGHLLDYGRTTYVPPQDLRDHVDIRDQYCRFPTCDRPAVTCDADHRHNWIDGCATNPDCLDDLCRTHHRLRHEGGWSHERDPVTRDSIWTDPAGRTHVKPATTLPAPPPLEPPAPADPPF